MKVKDDYLMKNKSIPISTWFTLVNELIICFILLKADCVLISMYLNNPEKKIIVFLFTNKKIKVIRGYGHIDENHYQI